MYLAKHMAYSLLFTGTAVFVSQMFIVVVVVL